jgi:hypothetical protein
MYYLYDKDKNYKRSQNMIYITKISILYCVGVVNELRGPKTVCCGKTSMNEDDELCCGESPVPRPSKDYNTCCKQYAYNPKTEVCCGGMYVYLERCPFSFVSFIETTEIR